MTSASPAPFWTRLASACLVFLLAEMAAEAVQTEEFYLEPKNTAPLCVNTAIVDIMTDFKIRENNGTPLPFGSQETAPEGLEKYAKFTERVVDGFGTRSTGREYYYQTDTHTLWFSQTETGKKTIWYGPMTISENGIENGKKP